MKRLLSIALGAVVALGAGPQEMGAPPRTATFQARQEFKVIVPDGARKVRAWFTMPQEDPAQDVKDFKVECPFPHTIQKDSEGNTSVYVEVADPKVKDFAVVETFTVTRKEIRNTLDPAKAKPITDEDRSKMSAFLGPNKNIVITDEIRKIAKDVVGDDQNPVTAARKLYDWVLGNIDYWVKDPDHKKASPVGSSEYCLSTKTGNCTDFHSLWTSLARAQGIPTRMVYGSFFKAELDGKDKDQSYHCWPEFYVPGYGWVPHDVAVADIFVGDFEITKANDEKVRLTTGDGYKGADKAKVDYYFGSIDERRVTWSRGRDLTLSPKQDAGPVNALAKAYVEIDGATVGEKTGDKVNWSRKLTFTQQK